MAGIMFGMMKRGSGLANPVKSTLLGHLRLIVHELRALVTQPVCDRLGPTSHALSWLALLGLSHQIIEI